MNINEFYIERRLKALENEFAERQAKKAKREDAILTVLTIVVMSLAGYGLLTLIFNI